MAPPPCGRPGAAQQAPGFCAQKAAPSPAPPVVDVGCATVFPAPPPVAPAPVAAPPVAPVAATPPLDEAPEDELAPEALAPLVVDVEVVEVFVPEDDGGVGEPTGGTVRGGAPAVSVVLDPPLPQPATPSPSAMTAATAIVRMPATRAFRPLRP